MEKILKVKNFVCFSANEGLLDHSPYYNKPRHYNYTGKCIICGRRTYEFSDGNNDPRGPLGDHANHPLIAEEYNKTGKTFPLCAICANIYEPYKQALDIANKTWK
jgi:hypothetical protein